MATLGRTWRPVALGLAVAACGGGEGAPVGTTPLPTPTPAPTPTPRVTFRLSAPSDHYLYSDRLTPLSTGQSFEITFKVLQLDVVSGEEFLHAVEFWISSPGDTGSVEPEPGSIALGFGSTGGTEWRMHYWANRVGYVYTRLLFEIELGQQRLVRMSRRSDGIAEYFLDGVSVLTVADVGAPAYARARVVGSTAEFSHLPVVSTVRPEPSGSVGPRRCEQCPARTPP